MKILKNLAVLGLFCGLLLGAGSKPAASLQETQWNLIEVAGAKVSEGRAGLILKNDLSVNGSGGVNRFAGKYTLENPDKLTFLPLAATKMAGLPPAMQTEDNFFKALDQTRSYKITSSKLSLLGENGKNLAVLEAAAK
jgi:heat shock protein HslJ